MNRRSSIRGRKRERSVVMPPALRYRSMSNSNSRSRKRPCTSTMRMRPWMEALLDEGKCQSLSWVNKAEKIFSIVWRHKSSHGFDQHHHGDLFSLWAQHKGKLQRGSLGEHSTNKSTFRCALHSLKDCIELTGNGEKRGEEAKRTYQFIDPCHPKYDSKRKKKGKSQRTRRQSTVTCKEESPEYKPDLDEDTDEYQPHTEAISPAQGPSLTSTASSSNATAFFSGAPLYPSESNTGSIIFTTGTTTSSSSPYLSSAASGSHSTFSASPPSTAASALPGMMTFCSLTSSAQTQTSTVSPALSITSQQATVISVNQTPDLNVLLDQPRRPVTRQSTRLQTKRSKLVYEPGPDGIISLSFSEDSTGQGMEGAEEIPMAVKQEAQESRQESLPNFRALGLESYTPLNNINNQYLNSGGRVIIKTERSAALAFPEINCSQFSSIAARQPSQDSSGQPEESSQGTSSSSMGPVPDEMQIISELDYGSQVEIPYGEGDGCEDNDDDDKNFQTDYMVKREQPYCPDIPTEEVESTATAYLAAQNTLNMDLSSSAAVVEPINQEEYESLQFLNQPDALELDIFTLGFC